MPNYKDNMDWEGIYNIDGMCLRVADPAEYDGKILVERVWPDGRGGWKEPAVFDWTERGWGEFDGPFASVEEAEKVLQEWAKYYE